MGIEFIECYTPPEDVVTCSVKLDFSELADYSYDGVILRVVFAEFGNNGIRLADRTYFDNFPTEITLENVVMNSAIYMASKLPIAPRIDIDAFTLAHYERGVFCLVPKLEDLTIQFYYDVNEVVDATPEQVEEGVKFVGANGVVEEGKLPLYDGTDMDAGVLKGDDEYAYIQSSVEKTSIIEDVVYSKVPLSQFGNATAADVRAGVRFTSAEGYDEEGEMSTIALPEPTIHFDADTGRILSVVTHSEDGFVEKGENSAYTYLMTKKAAVIEPSNTTQTAVPKGYFTTGDVTVAPIPDYYIDASDMSVFGNASPMSVMSSVTFTSEDGVKIWGALENLSEDDLNRARFDDEDNNDADDFKFWAEAKQRGVVESGISFKVPKTNFGFVTPDLVPEGYTFTSMYGFDIGGRMPSKGDDDLTVDGNKVTVPAGYYPYGAQKTAGVTIDTCTVNVTFSKNAGITLISATTFENGTISVVNQPVSNNNSGRSFSIPNVVCGSALSINSENIISFYGSFNKYYHGFSLGGTITVPTSPGTYTVEVGELDD